MFLYTLVLWQHLFRKLLFHGDVLFSYFIFSGSIHMIVLFMMHHPYL
jgi:hypothetical protein